MVGWVAALASFAAVIASLDSWATVLVVGFIVFVAARALRDAPGRHRVERIVGGRIRLRTPTGVRLHGDLQPAYCSRLYCAFTVHDPACGARRFGLFRDELDADGWRQLRVALRSGGRH